MKGFVKMGLLITLSTMLIVGCTQQQSVEASQEKIEISEQTHLESKQKYEKEEIKTPEESLSQQAGMRIAYSEVDQKKYNLPEAFEIDFDPQRLIVMTAGPVEILHKLGVNMIAVPDILDESQTWVQEVDSERLPLTGKTLDTEKIIALQPDMLVMSAGKREAYGKFFEEQNIPVYYVSAAGIVTIESVKEQVNVYAEAFKRTVQGADLISELETLEERIKNWKIDHAALQGQELMILLNAPFTYTNTTDTTIGKMVEELGLVNRADSIEGLTAMMGTQTLEISSEVIIDQNPPVILAMPTGVGGGYFISTEDYKALHTKEFEQNYLVWGKLDAVKNDKIVYLGTDIYPGTNGLGIIKCYDALMQVLSEVQ